MGAGIARLGVDVGASTTVAVVALVDGQRITVMPDGEPTTPSGVYVDPDSGALVPGQDGLALAVHRPDCYIADVKSHLVDGVIAVAGRTVDPIDLFAAVLHHISTEAARITGGPPQTVALAVPPAWGPRRRTLIRDAARRAGLPEPDLVAEPAATAAYLAAATASPPPAGTCVLLCDAGAATLQLTVLQQIGPNAVQQLATATVPNASGSDLDRAIAEQAAHTIRITDPPRWSRLLNPTDLPDLQDHHALWQATRLAKETLRHAQRAAVVLPDPYPPAVIDHNTLNATLHHIRTAMPTHVNDILNAADVELTQIQAVILTGGGAHLPGIVDILHAATGRTPIIPARNDIATADGALHAIHHTSDARARHATLPRVRLTPRHVIAPALLGAASFALLIQAVATADIRRYGLITTSVRLPLHEVGAAGLLAMLTALAVAHLAPTTSLTGAEADTSTTTGTLIRRAFTSAALLGLTVAGIYGLAIGALVGLSGNTYAGWSILSAAPVAAASFIVGLVAPQMPATSLPVWLHRTQLPLTATLLAAAGILAMRYAGVTSPDLIPGGYGLVIRAGAAAIGIAIALTVTRRPLARVATATLLGAGFGLVGTYGNTPFITSAYICALAWWALTSIAATTAAAYSGTARRLRALGTSGSAVRRDAP